jgi:[acyl-carrier-protein] S-malonyltransferase
MRERIDRAALAFRGYEVGNFGRSRELIDHPRYGPVVRRVLGQAARICADLCGQSTDLIDYIRAGKSADLKTLPQDNAMIVALEVAQLQVLEELFDVSVGRARLSFGFSTGELAALIVGKVFTLEDVLGVLVPVAADCAELASDASLALLFTKRSELRSLGVERICREVLSEGRGLIGPTAFLSPHAALVVGQGKTLNRLESLMRDFLPKDAVLRRKRAQWTPLHSPLVWQCYIPNRIATLLHRVEGKLRKPSPPVLSCVTGEESYDELSSRELLTLWPDHPQRLWDVVNATLKSNVDMIVHVGPASNLLTTTFSSLSGRVIRDQPIRWVRGISASLISGLQRRPMLSGLVPPRAALLRAPFLTHVILEDWLLDQNPACCS